MGIGVSIAKRQSFSFHESYLIRIKKERAELALEFRKLVTRKGPQGFNNEIFMARQKIALRMSELNQRGAKGPPPNQAHLHLVR